jgi:replicative DNA helicase
MARQDAHARSCRPQEDRGREAAQAEVDPGSARLALAEIEKGIIGCLIVADDTYQCDLAYQGLIPEDFTVPYCRDLFDALSALRQRGSRHPDLNLLYAELESRGKTWLYNPETFSELIGGEYSHLAALPSEIPEYVRRIREERVRRSLSAAAGRVAHGLDDRSATPQSAAEALQRAIDESMSTMVEDSGVSYRDALLSALDRRASPDRYIRTGMGQLDRNIGGFAPGELIIVAARPFMGKTIFCANLASRISARAPVEFWSLEMDLEAMAEILWQCESNVPMPPPEARLEDLSGPSRRLAERNPDDLPITLHDGISYVEDLIAQMGRASRARGSKVMFLDNINLLSSRASTGGNRAQEMAVISRRLKMAAKDLGVAVVCIAHLNRGSEARDDKRPRLSDLRDSGTIEQDADAVLFLYAPSYHKSADQAPAPHSPRFMRLYAEKRRGYGRSFTKLLFTPTRTRFDAHNEDDSAEFQKTI